MTGLSIISNIVLWIPSEKRPTVFSFGFTIVRMAVFSALLVAPAVLLGLDPGSQVGNATIWAIFVTFEELARLSMVRQSTNKWMAGLFFVVGVVVLETVGLYRPGLGLVEFALVRAPTIALHIGYTSAMIWLTKRPAWLPAGFLILTCFHWVYDIFASSLQ